MPRSMEKLRIDWLARYLATDDNDVERTYAIEFSRKILKNFHKTGMIPESRLKYICIVVHYGETKPVRQHLTKIGIKHRVYSVQDCYEFVFRKSDYNFYKLTLEVNRKDFESDIYIHKLYEDYKVYEKNLIKRREKRKSWQDVV